MYYGGTRKYGTGRPMRGDKKKTPVLGIVERKGRVVAKTIESVDAKTLVGNIHKHVMPEGTVFGEGLSGLLVVVPVSELFSMLSPSLTWRLSRLEERMGGCVPSAKKGSRPIHIIDPLPVQNSLGIDLILQGSYNSEIKKLTVQFLVRGTGPICRVCVNGRFHRGLGRTHKHDLHEEEDPSQNLPKAVGRSEFDGQPLSEVWKTVCRQARITHNGTFNLPAGGAE